MPALNVTFTAEELEDVRMAAQRQNMSLKGFAHDAVMSAAGSSKVAEIAASVAERSAELNERLAR